MKLIVSLSTAVFVASLLMPPAAVSSQEKKIVREEKRFKKIEETVTFLGVQMQDLDESGIAEHDYPHQAGVLIIDVVDESPAEKAGIRKGDIIFSLAGEIVQNGGQLAKRVASRAPGDEVEIVLYRGGKQETLRAELAARSTSYVTLDLDHSPPYVHLGELGRLGRMIRVGGDGGRWSVVRDRARLGVHLHDLDQDLAPYFKLKAGEGMLVLEVVDGSAAGEAGIRTGDVIVRIDDSRISDFDDVFEALDRAEGREKVAVTIVRKGKKMELPVEFGGKDARMLLRRAPDEEKSKELRLKRIPGLQEITAQSAREDAIEKKIEALEREIEKLKQKLEQDGQTD